MDHLKDVLSPASLDGFNVNAVAEGVVCRDVRVVDLDLARVVEVLKSHHTVSILGPLLKLPLHLNLFVLFDLLVNALDGSIKHLKFALGHRFRHCETARELADLDLVSHRLEDD